MLRTESIAHSYHGQNLLKFKDWEIAPTEQWLLLGDSGSGKTTLIHILTGLLKPEQGKVFIDSTDIYSLSQKKLDKFRGQHIGLIFQRPHLIKSLTIRDNIRIAQSFAGLPINNHRIDEVLETLGILNKSKNYPHELSQGQLQRVSIARAVINKPTIVVADEPTSSLDDKNTEAVLDLLISQSALNGSTLLIATHDKRVKQLFTKQYLV
jgi:putative ABC transport system ATP-binding protein